ncbi:MAG: GDSL-type esterase/lipase family protein [Planctomycetia bacterium]|nr:GDSL-type esterase/lipase family protein [Planctomycetia bacterium]
MKSKLSRIVATLLTLACLACTSVFAQNPATTLENRDIPRYHSQLERMEQGQVDLLWVGDSITHFWEDRGKEVWDQYYADRNAMNFAISGDRTGQVLWRMANSPMDKISPKMIVVMIGTNNIGHKKPGTNEMHSTPAETVEGIQAIVNQLKDLYPTSKILLLEVFPRGNQPTDPLRLAVNDINAGLEKIYANGAVENVQLYSINDLFLDKDGVLSPDIMPDYLHPNKAGYEIWAKAIEPMIADGLNETPVDCQASPVDADWWRERFNAKNELLKAGNIDVLMIGDSITHGWEGSGAEQWQKYYGDMNAINLGHGGDQTQHVLWRLNNYDFSAVSPKSAVLLIGVNNTWGRDRKATDIALGQRRIVKKLQELFPNIKIVVLKVFPCTSQTDQIEPINALTELYMRDLPNVQVVDIGKVFLNKDGELTKEVMPDLLHPNAVGYESWGASLYLLLNELNR